MATSGRAIWVVLICAALWGFWWLPVRLFEDAGLTGPWIGLAISAAALPLAVLWWVVRPAGLSPRAAAGAAMVGLAVTLYAMAASYTDFIRAVLLFYLAPAWSTLIEIVWFGRRWTLGAAVAVGLSVGGVLLITGGRVSTEGLGAAGDFMALASGLCWSIGVALIFSSRRANVSAVFGVTVLGGIAAALVIAAVDGSLWAGLPAIDAGPMTQATAFTAVYVGVILAGTMWGAFHLPPAVMTYLLSVEILGGVLSSALILNESFGWAEVGGAAFIVAAVFVEILAPRVAKTS